VRLPDPADRPWLTVAEVARITGEGEKAIRSALDAGHLPVLRVGRYVRIPTARLRQVLGIDCRPLNLVVDRPAPGDVR
jgi:excisionase family DNA binding protein